MNHRDAIRHTMRALREPSNVPRERPILFSGPMIGAILSNTKSQTRRIVKPQPVGTDSGQWFPGPPGSKRNARHYANENHMLLGLPIDFCPYGARMDRLWVRETHRQVNGRTLYFADDTSVIGPWKPSIFMPRAASRITLEITEVRVERLQEISKADVIAEGITKWGGYSIEECHAGWHQPYADLWDFINGDGSWAANPFVWVVAFRRVKP